MPSTSNIIKKGQAANFVWGLPNGVNITTYGRVQSFRSAATSEKEPLKDGDGNTDGVIYYDLGKDGTLEAIIPTSNLGSTEIAAEVTIDGNRYLIEGCEKNWTAGAWAKITLTLHYYANIAIAGGTST